MNQEIQAAMEEIKEVRKAAGARKRAEGTAVKNALKAAGYTVTRVGHGTGTGSGWLHVEVDASKPANCQCAITPRNMGRCQNCGNVWSEVHSSVTALAQEVTGRTGDWIQYNGYIQTKVGLID